MAIKGSSHYQELIEALEIIKDLAIPEVLQKTVLDHLLSQKNSYQTPLGNTPLPLPASSSGLATTSPLRAFISQLKHKAAVSEIPCLAYWTKVNENQELLNEKTVLELYRRAGLRPPKNINQSLRDLCSKKYGRLESAENGQVRLSRVGEDFVLHDVIGKND